jgi:hypothetical protein
MSTGFRLAAVALSCAAMMATASCADSPTAAGGLYAGEWSGSTTQGTTIRFTVSRGDQITSLTIGHSFNGCSGERTFSGLSVAVQRQLAGSGAIFHFESIPLNGRTYLVDGQFPSSGAVSGVAVFGNFEACGNGLASFDASRVSSAP